MSEPIPLDEATEQLREQVRVCAERLREFSDSVVIVCTLNEGEATDLVHSVKGHHWAAVGSVERLRDIMAVEQRRMDGFTEK